MSADPLRNWDMHNERAAEADDHRDRWQALAACRAADVDPAWFYAEAADDPDPAALAYCAQCRVAVHCVDFAIDTNEKNGTWGGMNRRRRSTLAGRPVAWRHRIMRAYIARLRHSLAHGAGAPKVPKITDVDVQAIEERHDG